jgi:conjugal transfer mating pair stabilization protein TraG
METFEVFTIGNAYFLDKIFNAIKMIFSSGLTGVLKIAVSISLGLLAVRSLTTSNFKEAIKWMASVVVLMGLFLNTKANIVIHDQLPDQIHRIQAPYKVDNVPLGLAWLAYATSNVGKVMMEKFEMAFSGVTNNQTYRKYGILFGSKVIEDANRVSIRNPDLKSNMLKFYRQCIVPDLKMGHNRNNGYTLKDLAQTEDIALFLKDHASQARNIYLTANYTTKEATANTSKNFFANMLGKTTKTSGSIDGYVSCNKAAHVISDMVEQEIEENKSFYASTFTSQFMGTNDNAQVKNQFFEAVLKDTYGAFLKSSRDASEILKQNVMINSLGESSKSLSRSYGKTVSDEMTRSSMYSVSQIFQKFIPVIRSVFECLFYGVAPIIVILLVTPIGLEVLKNYAFSFLYLQMWPPMYAILYVITESWTRMSANGLKHNMEALPQIEAINYDISMVSGYMLAFIPVISIYITKGVISSIGNMTNSMMYIPQTAAVTTSDQAVKGNYTIGNASLDNHSFDNTNAHKHDTNFSYLSGMKTFQQPTGSVIKESPAGDRIMDLSGSTHNIAGLANINWNQAIGSRYDESESQAKREMETANKDYVENVSAGTSKILGYDSSYSKGTAANEAINKSMTHDQRKAVDYVKGVTERIAEEHGISSADVINMAAYAKAGLDFLGSGGGTSITGSTESSKKEAWSAIQDASKEQKFSESLGILESYGKTMSTSQSTQESEFVLESVKSDFAKSNSASSRVSNAQEKIRNIQEQRSNYQNNSSAIDLGLNNSFVDLEIQKYGVEGFEKELRNNPKQIMEDANFFLKNNSFEGRGFEFKALEKRILNLTAEDGGMISDLKADHDKQLNIESLGFVSKAKEKKQDLRKNYIKNQKQFSEHREIQEAKLESDKSKIDIEHQKREYKGISKTNQAASQQFGSRIIDTGVEMYDFFTKKDNKE